MKCPNNTDCRDAASFGLVRGLRPFIENVEFDLVADEIFVGKESLDPGAVDNSDAAPAGNIGSRK